MRYLKNKIAKTNANLPRIEATETRLETQLSKVKKPLKRKHKKKSHKQESFLRKFTLIEKNEIGSLDFRLQLTKLEAPRIL